MSNYVDGATTVFPPTKYVEKIVPVYDKEGDYKGLRKETLRAGDDLSKAGVKFDEGKTPYSLVPPEGTKAVAEILAIGAKKYAPRNWERGMAWSRPFDAMQRHLWAWWGGQTNDPDTGRPHLWHAACNCFFLIAYEARNTGTDDRPKASDAVAFKP